MSGSGRPATTAGWTTSCRLILADRWRPSDDPDGESRFADVKPR
jgi:hypothetical protein